MGGPAKITEIRPLVPKGVLHRGHPDSLEISLPFSLLKGMNGCRCHEIKVSANVEIYLRNQIYWSSLNSFKFKSDNGNWKESSSCLKRNEPKCWFLVHVPEFTVFTFTKQIRYVKC